MSAEDQALIEAHVEHLVEVELAHRKEIATLQAMVVQLRGQLGAINHCDECVGCRTHDHYFITGTPSPPDSPVAALPCGCITHPWGGSCPKPPAPPVSTVDSRLAALEAKLRDVDDRFNCNTDTYNLHRREHYALEARVAALETWRGALEDVPDGIQHEYVNDGKKRCEVCGVRQYAECHAVPGAAKP